MVVYPYWIEHDENGNPANYVWVKVDSIPIFSTKTIYAAKIPGYSPNGEDTFVFFDDFDGSSLDTNKWTTGGKSGKYSISVSNSKLNIHLSDTIHCGAYIKSNYDVDDGSHNNVAVCALAKQTDYYTSAWGFMFGITTSSPTIDTTYYWVPKYPVWYSALWDYTSQGKYLKVRGALDSYTSNEWSGTTSFTTRNLWTRIETKKKGDDLQGSFKNSSGDVTSPSVGVGSTGIPYPYIAKAEYKKTTDNYVDFIFVTKYYGDYYTDLVVTVTNLGNYYKIEIKNNLIKTLSDYQIRIPISDLNISLTNESIKFADTPPSPSNTALFFSHNF